mmetsp:Transcript_2349/g.4382  ORF Transcript_2349/g.4382 Transcript_2349/m.4382 type:complete len:122 (-) Transcript_2349:3449-3814(-)
MCAFFSLSKQGQAEDPSASGNCQSHRPVLRGQNRSKLFDRHNRNSVSSLDNVPAKQPRPGAHTCSGHTSDCNTTFPPHSSSSSSSRVNPLLRTFFTKSSTVTSLAFTPRNVLNAAGVFCPQ